MTEHLPVVFVWMDDGSMRPASRKFAERCDQQFAVGARYYMAVVEDHSTNPFRQAFFAQVNEVYKSLPEGREHEFASATALRKHAQIKTGIVTIEDTVCTSAAEARRVAAVVNKMKEEYAVVLVEGNVVRLVTPLSMHAKMPMPQFREAAEKIRHWIAQEFEINLADLRRQRETP